jgi:hypothetical protein
MADHPNLDRTLSIPPPRDLRMSRPRVFREWVAPIVGVAAVAMLFFVSMYALDVLVMNGEVMAVNGLWQHYLSFDPELLTDALPALGMTIVAALGIVLTVVAIIVQLSSERYTGVALMFLRDRTNIVVMCFYVVASLCALWLSVSLQEGFVPRSLLLLAMGLASLALALMLPYFAYVFWFLEPGNIVDRLRTQISRLNRRGLVAEASVRVEALQGRVLTKMEEIADIANNSIDGRDKMVAGRAVDALRDFLLDYIATKPDRDLPWYRIGRELRENPNFVAMDQELLVTMEQRRLWVEWKTLRQYLGVYNEALDSMQEINSLIAINTRYIGEVAARHGQVELVRMVFRFMNSYLRSAINERSVITSYNVLHQYRMLLEGVLREGLGDVVHEGVGYLKYYGHMGFKRGLTFITETVGYDIAALCRFAHARGMAEDKRILRQFLDLDIDGPTRGYRQERRLRGVRKAQLKLAVYYLSAGEETRAHMIADDLRDEPVAALASLRDDLAKVSAPHFWEIVDRGGNFDYLPEHERALLGEFFSWLKPDHDPATQTPA